MNFNNIPDELKSLNQWVCYRIETIDGDQTKVPYIAGIKPNNGSKAKTTDPMTFRSFNAAVNTVTKNLCDGIGFVFTANDPYFGIDFDKCVDPDTGAIDPQVQKYMQPFKTYTERSQSGRGFHVIGKGTFDPQERKREEKKKIEVYNTARYFVMTGDILNGHNNITDCQKELTAFREEIFGKPKETKSQTRDVLPNLDDEKILELFRKADNHDKFQSLFNRGDISEYDGDDSRADMALACMIAFYTTDPDQIERIMRRSALTRDKWDNHRTYLQGHTIPHALNVTTEHYSGRERRTTKPKEQKQTQKNKDVQESETPIIVASFRNTDLGNSERLIEQHSENIRYCHPMKSWLIWDTKRWRPDDTLEIEKLSKETVRTIYAEAANCSDDKERKEISQHATRSEANAKIQAMIALARSEPKIIAAPDNLDQDPFLLNCKNGTVNLKTGTLQLHARTDNITKLVNINYDPNAPCPKWTRFLSQIFMGNNDLVRFIQYSVGYSLTASINEQCFFLCYGTGANGKSTFLDTISDILGDYGRRVEPTTFEDIYKHAGPREDIAGLKQTRFISTIETAKGKRLAENLLKQMTGDSTIRARFLYQNSFEFNQTYKIWIATNNKPIIRGNDDAIWRRVRLIPFKLKVEPENQNPELKDELHEEIEGILAWAVEGALSWNGIGLRKVTPQCVIAATDEYRNEMDSINNFIKECCSTDLGTRDKAANLHNAFLEWSGENVSRKEFVKRLEELNFKKIHGKQGVIMVGITLNIENDLLQ